MQAAEKTVNNLQKEVGKATEHISKLTERVRKAEAGQAEAQNKLASAGVEASTARKLVEAVSPFLPCSNHACCSLTRCLRGAVAVLACLYVACPQVFVIGLGKAQWLDCGSHLDETGCPPGSRFTGNSSNAFPC